MQKIVVSLVAITACQLAVLSAACAQDAKASNEEAVGDAVGEIIVTAERREQNLQKLPTTASALSGKNLADQHIERIDDLMRATPGLAINDSGLGKFVNMRGIGKGADLPGIAAGVAYYVDGVPIPNQVFLETPFFDLSRVEVLRGPQGTLVGMNSTGGAVLIVSQNPKYDVTEGSLEMSYGNYDDLRVRGVINLPLSDAWAVRVSAEYEKRDSFFTNVGPAGGQPGNVDRLSLRGTLAGKLSDNVEVFLRVEHNRNDTDGNPSKPIPGDPEFLYTLLNANSPADPFKIGRFVAGNKDTNYTRVSGELRVNIADSFELRSVTGYQRGKLAIVNDFGASSLPTARQTIDIDEPVFTQEVNLISTPGGNLDWVVGAFYLRQNTHGELHVNAAIGGAPVVELLGRYRVRNFGLFGQATYHATDALNVTLGLRYNNERHFSAPGGRTVVGGVIVIPTSTDVSKDEALTGRLTVDYELSRDHFLYGTVSRGFKGGGINDSGLIFGPEKIWNYEAGLKSSFAHNHLRTQLGLFYNDYKSLQFEVYSPVTTLSAIQNFGSAKIYGFELQGQAHFGGLALNAAVAYTKSKLGSGSLVDPRYGASAPTDITGFSLNYSPKWSFNAGAEYAVPVGLDFVLTPRIQYSYLASQWANVFHVTPTDFIGSRNVADASVTLAQEGKGWHIEAYATNLFDEVYIVSKNVTAAGRPGRVQFYGAPRQYGLRVGYSF